tara:strand:+ start:4648 stop:4845 length:198 start_codon:yes stop_codon:yes gene_type:complete
VIYTAVFQDTEGQFSFETGVAPHDRTAAWKEFQAHSVSDNVCLVLLIDGHANLKTYSDILDMAKE